MQRANAELLPLEALAQQDPLLNWYVIADSAQHADLPAALVGAGNLVKCLFGASQDSPVARHAPHLVELGSPTDVVASWDWIGRNANKRPCVSIIATYQSFDSLFEQLHACTEVALPDGEGMFFAFWDPAILGTLMGQPDDQTLYIKGPVLSASQRAMLVSSIAQWFYWDRDGFMHAIITLANENVVPEQKLSLTQEQVDDLVEASIPDHILYHIELHNSDFISTIPALRRYAVVRQATLRAREIGLVSMLDLINYVCAEIIYEDRIDRDPIITSLLKQVQRKELAFSEALELFP